MKPFLLFSAWMLFFLIEAGPSAAQKKSMTWGDVPREHIEMIDFPADTNASAVILGDFGEVYFIEEYNIVHERHIRIKILSSSGFDEGDIRLPYYAARRTQRLDRIKAQTINVSEDGSLEYYEVPDSDIHHEDLDGNFRAYIFTMPALEVGSIIEYSYRVRSSNPTFLRSWEFQSSEPTLWSQFEVEIPNNLVYARVSHNSVPFDLYEVKENVRNISLPADRANSTRYTWAVENAPAIRSEPYMTTRSDHITRIEFQLSGYQFPGMVFQHVMEDWDKLTTDLRRHNDFGRQRTNRAIRRQVRDLTEGIDDPHEKMVAIYDYVRENIEWDGRRSIFAENGIRRAFSRKNGNSGDIGLLLTSMLDRAGLDVTPVIISTRNNGRIQRLYPIATQFNHILTLVSLDDNNYLLLDATDPYRPYTLLPFNALTDSGLMIQRDGPEWINIIPQQAHYQRSVLIAELDTDGSISGDITLADHGYSSYRSRRAIRNGGETDFFNSILREIPNSSIISSTIENLDDVNEDLITKLTIQNHDHSVVSGENIFLNPFMLDKVRRNPFTLPNRSFPVDFGHSYDRHYISSITIPDGYEVTDLPENMRLTFDDKGEFTRLMQVNFNVIQVVSRFKINETHFEPEIYNQLQEFYDQIIQAQNEQIVLQKISSEAD